MNHLQAYFIAIVIGLLVGIEREKSHQPSKALGVRTFLMLSLLGACAGSIKILWISIILALFALSLIVVSYFTQNKLHSQNTDRGLTTEFAAGIIFCLGYMAHQNPVLSALMGPIVALILFSKTKLHRFTRKLKRTELEAALLLILAAVVVINLLPNHVIDPWGFFHPRKFGYIVLILAVLEFSSYLLSKIFGGKKSVLIIGFLGGFISSTVVLLSSAKNAKKYPQSWKSSFLTVIAANSASFLQLLFVVGIASPVLMKNISWMVGLSIGMSAAAYFAINAMGVPSVTSRNLALKSPLDWKGVFRFAIFFTIILASVSFVKEWLQPEAIYAISFLTGLFELQGISLANATLHAQGKMSRELAQLCITYSLIGSLVSKIILSWSVTRGKFSWAITGLFLFMILVICILAFVI